jgi:hypothetical protein
MYDAFWYLLLMYGGWTMYDRYNGCIYVELFALTFDG